MIELIENGNELKVHTPYSDGFNIKMKNLNGSWQNKFWVFSNFTQIKEAIINNINDYFQIDYNAPRAKVKITALKDIYAKCEPVLIGGYELAIAKGNNEKYNPVITGKNVVLLSGELNCSGSRKNWFSIVEEGAVFLIDDFPKLSYVPKDFKIEILEEKSKDIVKLLKNFTNEELKKELERRETQIC